MTDAQRRIPSIEQIRQRPSMAALEVRYGRAAVTDALRAAADHVRAGLSQGSTYPDVAAEVEQMADAELRRRFTPSLRRLINATGVIIHTNLGRAPLGAEAAAQVAAAAASYTNLEYELERGARGRRDVHAEHLLMRLTGAEAACVVNNNAAAALLVLAAIAAGREVVVSRGELVEIGGGFRVPDVMAQSGAVLREVGTTNRTRAADYAAAIGDRTSAILRIHPSNFRIEGFTERPGIGELAALARRFGIPLLEDLGSGLLAEDASLPEEPAVSASLAAGADVVFFSGDKLLGGPQAGIIVGRTGPLETIRRHPLMRALRVDKLTYAALEATLLAHASGRRSDVPVLRMMDLAVEAIERRATAVAAALRGAGLASTVIDGRSTIGGGSAPGETLPTKLVRLDGPGRASAREAALRRLDPPVIARIEDDHVVLDLRTVLPEQDVQLAALVAQAVQRRA